MKITATKDYIDFEGSVYFVGKLALTKENAFIHAMHMYANSWTYDRMTEDEQKRVYEIMRFSKVFGTFQQRIKQYNSLYNAFLLGLGYTDFHWRDA